MTETPNPAHDDPMGVLDVLFGLAPFVFLVGALSGLAAALLVWPVARRVGATQGPLADGTSRYLRGPVVVGGVGLFVSVAVDLLDRGQVGPVGPALAVRLLVVGGCLSAVTGHLQYREATPERRRAVGLTYTAFVVVWAALALGLYALGG